MIGLRDPVVYSLPGNEALAVELSAALHAEPGLSTHRTFPDGESYVRLVTNPRDRDVVIVATQRDPDPQLLRLVFAADAARALGARRVGLVAPYLAYMRQDRSFHTGKR